MFGFPRRVFLVTAFPPHFWCSYLACGLRVTSILDASCRDFISRGGFALVVKSSKRSGEYCRGAKGTQRGPPTLDFIVSSASGAQVSLYSGICLVSRLATVSGDLICSLAGFAFLFGRLSSTCTLTCFFIHHLVFFRFIYIYVCPSF